MALQSHLPGLCKTFPLTTLKKDGYVEEEQSDCIDIYISSNLIYYFNQIVSALEDMVAARFPVKGQELDPSSVSGESYFTLLCIHILRRSSDTHL